MAIYFLDSSALLKRYVSETGTSWVQSLFDPAQHNHLAIGMISGAEIVAAVSRRVKGAGLSASEGLRVIRQFRSDFQSEFELIEINGAVIRTAMDLAERHALRGYDAVQLAAASVLNGLSRSRGLGDITLVSSDHELNSAAVSHGINVDDPTLHP